MAVLVEVAAGVPPRRMQRHSTCMRQSDRLRLWARMARSLTRSTSLAGLISRQRHQCYLLPSVGRRSSRVLLSAVAVVVVEEEVVVVVVVSELLVVEGPTPIHTEVRVELLPFQLGHTAAVVYRDPSTLTACSSCSSHRQRRHRHRAFRVMRRVRMGVRVAVAWDKTADTTTATAIATATPSVIPVAMSLHGLAWVSVLSTV